MSKFARLIVGLSALLFLTAMGALDLRSQGDSWASWADSLQYAALEDGPDGEQPPVATFVRAYDGDDQLETVTFCAEFAANNYVIASAAGKQAAAPTHFPCAGFPTGPPRA